MRLTLAFHIYNKERWIESVLKSWISNLSGKNEYEIIIVFDGCKDRSKEIAESYLNKLSYEYKFLFADNKFEVFCNNLALQEATGDYIVFIQDDNWMYDKEWDIVLEQVLEKIPNIGVIGFLAGLKILSPEVHVYNFKNIISLPYKILHPKLRGSKLLHYERIEINRPHKKEYFWMHKVKDYELGVWQVDAINRPFCVSRSLLTLMGGLDKEFMPTHGDDLDLSLKLLQRSKINIYIPFDIVNVVGSKQTMDKNFLQKTYTRAMRICYNRYYKYLRNRKNQCIRKIMNLKINKNGSLQLEG
jgi:glycosyltransferase involved in cell wall biosynthesis